MTGLSGPTDPIVEVPVFREAGSALTASLVLLLLSAGALVADPKWMDYGNIGMCECEGHPLCLLAVRDGDNCKLLWAKDRAEADRLRPMMNTARREADCKRQGKSGFKVAGQCLSVSRADVIEHENIIQRKRAAAHADCQAKGTDTVQETITWKGIYEYQCDFPDQDADGDSAIRCNIGECYDSSAMFGGQCRQSSGCPGGRSLCGSPGCP